MKSAVHFGAIVLLLVSYSSAAADGAEWWFGTGEVITFVADVPPQQAAELEKQFGSEARIGHFSKRFYFLLPIEVWSWDGKFVLYHNEIRKEYVVPDMDEWREILDTSPRRTLVTPKRYWFPPGLVAFGGFVLVILVYRGISRGDSTSIPAPLEDPKLSAALGVYLNAAENKENPLLLDSEAFAEAVSHLVTTHEMEHSEAETSMIQTLEYCARRQANELRMTGSLDEESGRLEAASDAYTRAAELMAPWDEDDSKFLWQCVRRVSPTAD